MIFKTPLFNLMDNLYAFNFFDYYSDTGPDGYLNMYMAIYDKIIDEKVPKLIKYLSKLHKTVVMNEIKEEIIKELTNYFESVISLNNNDEKCKYFSYLDSMVIYEIRDNKIINPDSDAVTKYNDCINNYLEKGIQYNEPNFFILMTDFVILKKGKLFFKYLFNKETNELVKLNPYDDDENI